MQILSTLQTFKLKYAEARAKENPELRDVYMNKIKSIKEAGTLADTLSLQTRQLRELLAILYDKISRLEQYVECLCHKLNHRLQVHGRHITDNV